MLCFGELQSWKGKRAKGRYVHGSPIFGLDAGSGTNRFGSRYPVLVYGFWFGPIGRNVGGWTRSTASRRDIDNIKRKGYYDSSRQCLLLYFILGLLFPNYTIRYFLFS